MALNKHGLALSQPIKFEDQRLEEHPFNQLQKDSSFSNFQSDAFHRSIGQNVNNKFKKTEGVSKILKIKGVGKAENQKERLAKFGKIQYLENHFHEKE